MSDDTERHHQHLWGQIAKLLSRSSDELIVFLRQHPECLASDFMNHVFTKSQQESRANKLLASLMAMSKIINQAAGMPPSAVGAEASWMRQGLVEMLISPPTHQAGAALLERAQGWFDQDLRETVLTMLQEAQRAGLHRRHAQLSRFLELFDEISDLKARDADAKESDRGEGRAADVEQLSERELERLLDRVSGRAGSPESPGDAQLAARMVAAARRIGRPELMRGCLFHLGAVSLHRRDGATALAACEEALALARYAPARDRMAILGNLAMARELSGDVAHACMTLERLLSESADDEETGGPRANALLNLGRVRSQMGDFDAAIRSYEAALASAHGPEDRVIASLNGLANLHLLRREFAHAMAYAAAVLEQVPPGSRIEVQTRALIATVQQRLDLTEEAAATLGECLKSRSAHKDPRLAGQLMGNLAAVEFARGNHERAELLAGESLELCAAHNERHGVVVASLILHARAAQTGDEEAASALLQQALSVADEQHDYAAILNILIASAKQVPAQDNRTVSSERALEALRTLRRLAQTPLTRARFWEDAQAVLWIHLHRCLSGGSEQLRWEAASCLDEANSWMHMDELGMIDQPSQKSPSGAQLHAVQSLLGEQDWVLLAGDDRRTSTCFLLGRRQLLGPFFISLQALHEPVTQLAAALAKMARDRFDEDSEQRVEAGCLALVNALGSTDLWHTLGRLRIQRLVIAGSSRWQFLPLHALPLEPGGSPLIELCEGGISYVPAIGVYQRCAGRTPPVAESDATWRVFANPDLGDPALDLPSTLTEAAAFGRFSQLIQRRDVTTQRFLDGLAQSPRVAFLGHGKTHPWDAMSGGLLVTGAAGGPETLTARDILKHFSGAEMKTRLALISACHLGAPSIRFDRPLSGLPRVLLTRGCSAVIAHTWPLDDGLAEVFTRAVLSSFATSPAPGRAVRAGVLAMRAESPTVLDWAGCRLFGAL